MNRWFESHCQRGVFLVWAIIASCPLQNASVGLDHHCKNNGGSDQWIMRVKITPRLLKIHLSLLEKSSSVSAGDV